MLNKCDFEANIVVILLLFRFNRSKSICLGLGYGIFHTHKTPPFFKYERLRHSLPLLTVCVPTPNESVRCEHSGFSDLHLHRKSTETSL